MSIKINGIYPKTGESMICPWLYFAWEILNVDGVTWWYNLQACCAMGRLVGKSVPRELWKEISF